MIDSSARDTSDLDEDAGLLVDRDKHHLASATISDSPIGDSLVFSRLRDFAFHGWSDSYDWS